MVMCEVCGKSGSNFGFREDGVRRWCGPCARARAEGAVNLAIKQCEDCNAVRACFGRRDELLEEGRSVAARWCSACSKAHPGAEDVVSRRCEDCKARPLPMAMASVRVAPDSPPARFVLRSVTDGCTAPATRVSSAGDPPALCASDREHVTVVRQLRARTPWSHQRGFTTL